MIDRTQLRRLMNQIEPGRIIDDYAMKLAQAIYKDGVEDMRERAAAVCKKYGATLEVDIGDCFAEEIQAMEIEP